MADFWKWLREQNKNNQQQAAPQPYTRGMNTMRREQQPKQQNQRGTQNTQQNRGQNTQQQRNQPRNNPFAARGNFGIQQAPTMPTRQQQSPYPVNVQDRPSDIRNRRQESQNSSRAGVDAFQAANPIMQKPVAQLSYTDVLERARALNTPEGFSLPTDVRNEYAKETSAAMEQHYPFLRSGRVGLMQGAHLTESEKNPHNLTQQQMDEIKTSYDDLFRQTPTNTYMSGFTSGMTFGIADREENQQAQEYVDVINQLSAKDYAQEKGQMEQSMQAINEIQSIPKNRLTQADVDRYNAEADKYNAALASIQSDYEQYNSALEGYYAIPSVRANAANPTAFGAGNISGAVASTLGIGKLLGIGASALGAATGMSPLVTGALGSGATFGATEALTAYGQGEDAAGVAKAGARGALAGSATSYAGNLIRSGLGTALAKAGKGANIPLNLGADAVSGFGGAGLGTLATLPTYGADEMPSGGELAQQFAIMGLFQSLGNAMGTMGKASNTSRAIQGTKPIIQQADEWYKQGVAASQRGDMTAANQYFAQAKEAVSQVRGAFGQAELSGQLMGQTNVTKMAEMLNMIDDAIPTGYSGASVGGPASPAASPSLPALRSGTAPVAASTPPVRYGGGINAYAQKQGDIAAQLEAQAQQARNYTMQDIARFNAQKAQQAAQNPAQAMAAPSMARTQSMAPQAGTDRLARMFRDEQQRRAQAAMMAPQVAPQLAPQGMQAQGTDGMPGIAPDSLIDKLIRDSVRQKMQTDTVSPMAQQPTPKTAVNAKAGQHSPVTQQEIDKFVNAVDPGLVQFVQRVESGQAQPSEKYTVSPVSVREASDIQRLTGVDVSGFRHVITPSEVTHIQKRHGPKGTADQSMRYVDDVARLGYVMSNYDSVNYSINQKGEARFSKKFWNKDGSLAPILEFRKAVDGTYFVAEAIPDAKTQNLYITSAYMGKQKAGQVPGLQNTPGYTSKNGPAHAGESQATRLKNHPRGTSETALVSPSENAGTSRPGITAQNGVPGIPTPSSTPNIPPSSKRVNSQNAQKSKGEVIRPEALDIEAGTTTNTPNKRSLATQAKQAVRDFVAILAPRALATDAELTPIMQHMGQKKRHALEMVQAEKQLAKSLDMRVKNITQYFDRLGKDESLAYLDRYEKGQKQPTESLQAIDGFMREVQAANTEELVKLGKLDERNLIENYFGHLWKNPENEAVRQKIAELMGTNPLEKGRGFLKGRVVDFLQDGIDLGLEPVSYNPMTLFMRNVETQAAYITAQRMMRSYMDSGIVRFVEDRQRPPTGYVKLNEEAAKTLNDGQILAGEWYITKDAGRLVNNLLSVDYIRKNLLGKGVIKLKNFLTHVELSLGAFHYATTIMNGIGREVATGIQSVLSGDPRGFGQMIVAPVYYVYDTHKGSLVKKASYDKTFWETKEGKTLLKNYPNAKHLIDLLWDSGLDLSTEDNYLIRDTTQKTARELIQGNILEKVHGSAKYVTDGLTKVVDGLTKPLFSRLIPNIKTGVAFDLLAREIRANQLSLAQGRVTEAQLARKVINHVNDVFGAMPYDMLLHNKNLDTALKVLMRSPTWWGGNFRMMKDMGVETAEFAGKIKGNFEAAKWKKERISELKQEWGGASEERQAEIEAEIQQIEDIPLDKLRLGNATAFLLFGVALTSMLINGIISYASTGEIPNEPLDFIFPKTGEKDRNGNYIRRRLPGYLSAFYSFFENPGKTMVSSQSALVAKVGEVAQNRDYFGNYIYDPEASKGEQAQQIGEYLLLNSLPFTVRNAMDTKNEDDLKNALYSFFGFSKAASRYNMTPFQNRLQETYSQQFAGQPRTQEEAKNSQKARGITNGIIDGTISDEDIVAALESGVVTEKQVANAYSNQGLKPYQVQWKFLDKASRDRLWEFASAGEKRELAIVEVGRSSDESRTQGYLDEKDGLGLPAGNEVDVGLLLDNVQAARRGETPATPFTTKSPEAEALRLGNTAPAEESGFSYEGREVRFSGRQQVDYHNARQQAIDGTLATIMQNPAYAALEDAEKSKVLDDVYEVARWTARNAIGEYPPKTRWVADAMAGNPAEVILGRHSSGVRTSTGEVQTIIPEASDMDVSGFKQVTRDRMASYGISLQDWAYIEERLPAYEGTEAKVAALDKWGFTGEPLANLVEEVVMSDKSRAKLLQAQEVYNIDRMVYLQGWLVGYRAEGSEAERNDQVAEYIDKQDLTEKQKIQLFDFLRVDGSKGGSSGGSGRRSSGRRGGRRSPGGKAAKAPKAAKEETDQEKFQKFVNFMKNTSKVEAGSIPSPKYPAVGNVAKGKEYAVTLEDIAKKIKREKAEEEAAKASRAEKSLKYLMDNAKKKGNNGGK